MRRLQALAILVAMGWSLLVPARVSAQLGVARPTRIDEVGSLIPRDAPALLVANGPFVLTPPPSTPLTLGDRLRATAVGQPPDVLSVLRAQPELGVVVQAVAANAPADDAPGLFNGAHLILFQNGLRGGAEIVLRQLRDPSMPPLQVGGVAVSVRYRSGNGIRFPQYYAMPRANLFVSASNLAALQEIVLRSHDGASGVDLPAALQPYVGLIDTGAPIWAVRRLTDFDYLWRNAPHDQWPAALIFNWIRGRGRLGYVAGQGDLPLYALDQFERYALRLIQRDYGLIDLMQRNGMGDEQFTRLLLQGLGYGVS